MDNSPLHPQPAESRWTTPLAAAALGAAATLAAALLAVFGDGAAMVFWVVAAVCFAAFTVHICRARPRLAADASGATVRATLHTYRFTHGQLRVSTRRTRRLGREGVLLELDGIDTGGEERLMLLGRFDLGAEPADVLTELERLRGDQHRSDGS